MNENAKFVISSAITNDLPFHSPCLAFAHESSVLGCIGQKETHRPDDLPLRTPCVLQVSGWTAVESSDVRSPVAKSQFEKSVVMDLIMHSSSPRVRPDVLLRVLEILKKLPQPLKLKGRRHFRRLQKKPVKGTKDMNDTTTRTSRTCHNIIKTHIEPEFEEKTVKGNNLNDDPIHRTHNEHVSLRPDGTIRKTCSLIFTN